VNYTTPDLGGLVPKAAYVTVGSNNTDLGFTNQHLEMCVGATDGTTQWYALATDQNGVSLEDTYTGNNSGSLVKISDVGGNTEKEGVFTAFIADGITINWTTAINASMRLTIVLFAGADVSAKADVLSSWSSSGSKTGVGFAADLYLFAWTNVAYGTSIPHEVRYSLGAATKYGGSMSQWSVNGRRNQSSDNEVSGTSASYAIVHVSDAGAINLGMTVTDINSDGFDYTVLLGATTPISFLAIKITGCAVAIGLDTLPTATGDHAVSGIGFQPDFGLFQNSYNTSGAPISTTIYTLGQQSVDANYTISGFSCASLSTGTSQTATLASPTKLHQGDSTGAVEWSGTLTSWDSDGYTINFDNAPSSAWYHPYVLVKYT